MSIENRAVVERRREPPDSLDFFPTPPWATRALMDYLGRSEDLMLRICWEPAAGEGHMAEVLRERFGAVRASDVFDYGNGYEIGSFVGAGPDVIQAHGGSVDWVITNPPFVLAEAFLARALEAAAIGVAMLMRSNWIDSEGRWRRVFRVCPPTTVLQFAERVPMHKGRWDPDGSTATSYAWFVWRHGSPRPTTLDWIPPGQRKALTRPDDRARFAAWSLAGGPDAA